MILPALPTLAETWNQPVATINLILVCFVVTYAFFLLVYGPVSDRYGRRRPLMVGLSVFVVSSLLGAIMDNVSSVIFFRALQGAGAAAGPSLALAMSKDLFTGKDRERVLAYLGIIVPLAPMLAPTFGSWITAWLSWHWIFYAQAILGLIALIGVSRCPETLVSKSSNSLAQVAGAYIRLAKNPTYVALTLLMATIMLPFFGFIAGSSHIYITGFGLSEQSFGYFFAFNALCIMLGSFAFLRLVRGYESKTLITVGFAGILRGGLGLLFGEGLGPWGFALAMAVIAFSGGLSRPPSNNLILEQVKNEAGAASSLLLFTYFILGAAAMWFVSLEWESKQAIIGLLGVSCGGLCLMAWLTMRRMGMLRHE
jgi:DHA1 family bicyclomycin/chloramphenicol resistance-like MFS transporter